MPAPGPRTAPWPELTTHATRLGSVATRELFARDPGRYERFSRQGAGLLMDFSRQHLDEMVLGKLVELAEAVGLGEYREAMWRGERINMTEGRAVLHVALRQPAGALIGGAQIAREVLEERERMLDFAESVRAGRIVGSSGKAFNRVVNIGIGGGGPRPGLAGPAPPRPTPAPPRCECVPNHDGNQPPHTPQHEDPHPKRLLLFSKTFTTLETLTNARAARAWLREKLGEQAVREHFAAVSVNHRAMDEFGVHPEHRFKMWDWVGGRYSLWSSIGVSLAVAIGKEAFLQMLAGGHEMDEHFRATRWRDNLPALMGLIGVWNINFQMLPTLAVLPYDERLGRLPAYLQQLEMESNGKSVTVDGRRVDWQTAAVIWGEPGNNAQHSFFQLLHQGTQRAALDLLLPAKSSCDNQDQQDLAIANCLAQAEAFMAGLPAEAVREDLERAQLPAERIEELTPHKVHPGSRPGTLIAFPRLDPATLGKLIALYEHKVFTQGVVWGINSFDQWGVELGKKLCEQLAPSVRDPEGVPAASAGVTKLLTQLAEWRGRP